MDISSLSFDELTELRTKIDVRMAELKKEKAEEIRRTAESQAHELGLTLADIFPATSSKATKTSKVKPKYRHPENPELTWSGRGKTPTWISKHEEAGGSRDEFEI